MSPDLLKDAEHDINNKQEAYADSVASWTVRFLEELYPGTLSSHNREGIYLRIHESIH